MLTPCCETGDDGDLAIVYERVRPRLRAMASRFVGWDAAEDIVQDAFVLALTHPGTFRREASITTWLTRILVNAAIDETRRMKRRPACVAGRDLPVAGHGALPLGLYHLELKAALAAANRTDREVLVLVGLLGWTHEEAAGRLGVTAGRTKSRLWNARRRLRRALAGSGDRRG